MVGQQLKLQKAATTTTAPVTTYTVKSGDTLSSVAAKTKVSVAKLVSYNHIQNANLIHVGDVLKLTGTVATATTTTQTPVATTTAQTTTATTQAASQQTTSAKQATTTVTPAKQTVQKPAAQSTATQAQTQTRAQTSARTQTTTQAQAQTRTQTPARTQSTTQTRTQTPVRTQTTTQTPARTQATTQSQTTARTQAQTTTQASTATQTQSTQTATSSTNKGQFKLSFYDPAAMGSSLGYGGVAANLGVFPKGTRLKITLSNGTVWYRTVNDTGSFANSNPRQLDVAMPNNSIPSAGILYANVSVIN